MVRFGIIGCGAISAIFYGAVKELPEAKVTRVFDINPDRARAFAEQAGAQPCASMDELFSSPDVDAVYICTPSGMHADCVVRAANAGKHVVVEKPIGITEEQLAAITEACGRNHVKLSAISQLTFSDHYQKIKKAMAEGRLGKVFFADLVMKYFRRDDYYKNSGWRGTWKFDGGGALMNQGIHGVGLLLGLMGAPKSVTALARTFVHPIEVEDTAALLVEFQSGAIGNIIATTSVQPAKPRTLSIHGTKGTVTLTEDTITEWSVEGEENVPTVDRSTVRTSAANPTNLSSELHRRQLADFVHAVETDGRPALSLEEGCMPVDLILAAYRSSKEGKTVLL